MKPIFRPTSAAHPIICIATLFFGLFSQSTLALNIGDEVAPAVLKQLNYKEGTTQVVDFFAEWCESCRKELPLISKLNSQYTDNAKIVFMGVDTDDDLSVAQQFQKELIAAGALNFPVVNDVDQSIVSAFKPMGFPALYIIKDGVIVSSHLGATANIDTVIKNSLDSLIGQ